ncbi:hypothetical protein Tdes44962_MAKER00421 [Teratosphaeria destructans]|uniref:Uncharacterized protein n=1 Tax=Teratosphaeria destructans TaxID=418781 RepID=A0A9W7W2S1_9PEZI|nr:hypothetical protein Tdes44962_MAKER00421 [Teratosphaeria destructans]
MALHQETARGHADPQIASELVTMLDQFLWLDGDDTKILFHNEDVAPVSNSISSQVLMASTPDIPASLACYPDVGLDALLQDEQKEKDLARHLGAKIARIKKDRRSAWQLAHWRLLCEWQTLPTALQQSSGASFEKLELPQALLALRRAQEVARTPPQDSFRVTLVTSVETNGLPGSMRPIYLDAQTSYRKFSYNLGAHLPNQYLRQAHFGSPSGDSPAYLYHVGHSTSTSDRSLNTEEDFRSLVELLKGRNKDVLIWHERMWKESLASRAKWAEIKEMTVDVEGWEIFEPLYDPNFSRIDLKDVDLGIAGWSYSESEDQMHPGTGVLEQKARPQSRSSARKAATR